MDTHGESIEDRISNLGIEQAEIGGCAKTRKKIAVVRRIRKLAESIVAHIGNKSIKPSSLIFRCEIGTRERSRD